MHSIGAGKEKSAHDQERWIDEEALAGPDGPLPRKLTPEWVAVNLMDITAHLMAAIDKAAGPLERLADATEDATAHVIHIGNFLRQPIAIIVALALLASAAFGTYEIAGRWNVGSPRTLASNTSQLASEIKLGGVAYPMITREVFEARLATAQPESIRKYFVEIRGRKFPVKQAVDVGFGAPRASFSSEAAIHALTKLGYQTHEAN